MKVVRRQLDATGTSVDRLEAGPVAVTCIPEPGSIVWPARAMFADLSKEDLERAKPHVPAETIEPETGSLRLNFNVYLIEAPGLVALIDAGVGNHKERPDRPAWHRRGAPFLETLAALSIKPGDVDLMVTTHLHADHVGWNTVWTGSAWRPTFPNARYVVPRAELAFWTARAAMEGPESLLHGAYADSILPIIESVGYEAIESPGEIAPGLRYEPAPGHTDGMSVVRLATGADEVLFVADVMHHPLQMADIDIVSNFCIRPDQARATRRRIMSEAAESGCVVAPYHFPVPVFGHVVQDESAFCYRPMNVETGGEPAIGELKTVNQQ